MNFFASYNTDIGLRKHTNQDSIAIKMLDTPQGRAVFAVVCDGMGGLAAGELASKEVIQAFCDWFDHSFAKQAADNAFQVEQTLTEWRELAIAENAKLGVYGAQNNAGLGTTLSALLIYQNQYLIVHVGDSRIYEMNAEGMRQITEDQSVVAREIAAGRLTPEEALRDPRRSILLQCIGASPTVEPAFYQGNVEPETTYLVCSDGFCHEVSSQEIYEKMGPQACENPVVMRQNCVYLTDLVKQRKEQDNISIVLLKAY